MSTENGAPGWQRWWEDTEQVERFKQRMSGGNHSRRAALAIIGSAAAAAAAIACGSDDKSSGSGSSAPATGGSSSGQAGVVPTVAGGATSGRGPKPGEKLAREQTYRNTVTDEPATFDYNFNLYAASSSLVLAGLLKFDPENQPVPDIAESFSTNATGDVYTFKIRKGSKWSNGDEVTAKDYVYSWTRRLDPNSGADYKAFLHDIKNGADFSNKKITDPAQLGLKAVDDYTLEVTLQSPAGYFPALVAYQAAFPAHKATVEQFGKQYGTEADKFTSNGPFKASKWEHNKSFEIVKNEGYWDAKNITLTKITYQIIKQEQRVVSYENNEIDNVPSANVGDLKRLEGDSKLKSHIFKFDQVGAWYLLPNPKFEPFSGADGLKVRQAMAHVIDRDKLVKDVIAGLGTPAYTMNPPSTPFYNTNKYEQYTMFDPKMAMDLLKGTKYEGGKNWPKITMSMRNNEADAHKASMAALVQMFKEYLGMTIDQEIADPQVVYNEMRQGNKQMMWLRWYNDYPDANNTNYETFSSKIPAGSRRVWWDNPEYDDLVIKAKGEPNFEKRKALYIQSDEILAREAVGIFAYYPLAYGLRRPTVKGQPVNKAGFAVPDWNIFIREAEYLYITEA